MTYKPSIIWVLIGSCSRWNNTWKLLSDGLHDWSCFG